MKKIYFAVLTAFSIALMACSDKAASSDISPNQTGTGGSMARFAIVGNALYCVVPNQLKVFDISQPTNPVSQNPIPLNFGLETIFPYKDNLFIGANDGMYIFDTYQKAYNPTLISKFTHTFSCDPVVVQGNYAYITLRGGVGCRRFISQSSLDIVDISNLKNPTMVSSLPMSSPYGLGVDGTQLFVCEGDKGLKIFDISKPTEPILKNTLPNIKSFDVITLNKTLLVTGEGGFWQYSYKEGNSNLELLSKIPIEN